MSRSLKSETITLRNDYSTNRLLYEMDPQNILRRTASAVCPACRVSRPLQQFMNGEDRVYNVCKNCLTPNQPSWFIYKYRTTGTRPSWFKYVWATISFCIAFVFRYYRLGVDIVKYLTYRPSPIPAQPSYTSRDVSVLLPTIQNNQALIDCARSICVNNPAYLFVIAAGQELRNELDNSLEYLRNEFPTVNIQLPSTDTLNKRRQIDSVIPLIQTRLTCMVDATVIWGPRFLNSALAPLEDSNICLVGTNKRVQRIRGAGMFEVFWNFIGWLYVERHNFRSRAKNSISGEVFAISGRANVVRTAIIQDPNFRIGYMYTNERFFLNKFGPLAADDDNFIVRWVSKRGGGIKFQHDNDTCVDIVSVGEYPYFVCQSGLGYLYRWSTSPLKSLVYAAVASLSLLLGPWATDTRVYKLLSSALCYFLTRAVFNHLRLDEGIIFICLRSVYTGVKKEATHLLIPALGKYDVEI